jgi:TolB-like protein
MQNHLLSRRLTAAVLTACMVLTAGAAYAGQVVTDELRQWAREAVARENTLSTQPAPNTVGILYFDNRTGRSELDPLQKGLSLMLITDLAKIDTIQVVERVKLQALVDELKLGATGLVDPATAPRLGRLLGAAFLLGGQLQPDGKAGIHIDADLLRVVQRDTLGRPTSSGPFEELLRMEKEILFETVRLLRLKLSPKQIEDLKKPLTGNLDALMAWFRGIGFSDRQEYTQAAASYQKAVQADPGFKLPAAALAELRQLKLIPVRPVTGDLLQRLHERVSVNTGPVPNQIVRRERSSAASVQGPATQTTDVNVQWR